MKRMPLGLAVLLTLGMAGLTGCPEEKPPFNPPIITNPTLDMASSDMNADMTTDQSNADMTDMTSDMTDMNADMTDMADMPDICMPDDEATLCQKNNFECGSLTVEKDNCGMKREDVDCGEPSVVCTLPETCGGDGTTGRCGCMPTTCEEEGILCGEIPDGCGGTVVCDSFCVDSVVGGESHSCAIGSGNLKCWGYNTKGQLGNDSSTQANNPVDVVNLPANSKVTQATAGGNHTCALLNDSSVKCWGDNSRGQLGVGTTVDSKKPLDSAITSGVIKVVAGLEHTCALVRKPNTPVQEGYGVQCWGSNEFGQVGDPSLFVKGISVKSPRDVPSLVKGVLDIEAGFHHTCAQLVDGSLKCWGRNQFGQLGNLATNASLTDNIGNKLIDVFGWDKDIPVPDNKFDYFVMTQNPVTPPITNVISLSAGRAHTCALTRNRELFCWGAMADRSGGNASTCKFEINGVTRVTTDTNTCSFNQPTVDKITEITPKECAIFPNSFASTPGSVPLLEYSITKSSYGECGTVSCQGSDYAVVCPVGECGEINMMTNKGKCQLSATVGPNNDNTYKLTASSVGVSKAYLTPKKMTQLSYVESIASGRDHVCVLIDGFDTDMDTILDREEIGANVLVPVDSNTNNKPDFRDLDSDGDGISDRDEAGDDDLGTPAIDTDGDLTPNYLDDDSDGDTILDKDDNCPLVSNVNQDDADGDMVGDACAGDMDGDTIADTMDNCPKVPNLDQMDIDSNGVGDACQSFKTNIKCIGINEFSQLGDGSDSPGSIFRDVLPDDASSTVVRATSLKLGGQHSCALVNDNNVKCWGSNKNGQIGNSALSKETSAVPFDVKLDTNP